MVFKSAHKRANLKLFSEKIKRSDYFYFGTNGSLPGDNGFDPLSLSKLPLFEYKNNATSFLFFDIELRKDADPNLWLDAAKPLSTIEWMREAELKHRRICMLAILGWVAVDMG